MVYSLIGNLSLVFVGKDEGKGVFFVFVVGKFCWFFVFCRCGCKYLVEFGYLFWGVVWGWV